MDKYYLKIPLDFTKGVSERVPINFEESSYYHNWIDLLNRAGSPDSFYYGNQKHGELFFTLKNLTSFFKVKSITKTKNIIKALEFMGLLNIEKANGIKGLYKLTLKDINKYIIKASNE